MSPLRTDDPLVFARSLTERVIARLGNEAPPLRIDHVAYYHGFDEEAFESTLSEEPSERVHIGVRTDDPAASPMDSYFSVEGPVADSVVMTATGIQDHVLEYTHGALLPPCPGHRHPLQADILDGVASWVCPQDRAYYSEPILPPG